MKNISIENKHLKSKVLEDRLAKSGYPLKVGQIKNNNSQTIKRLIRLL
jgi:hypothetical protein